LAIRCNDGTEFLSCAPPTSITTRRRRDPATRIKIAKKSTKATTTLGAGSKKAKKAKRKIPKFISSTATVSTCSIPDDPAWAETKCLANGGFDQVLPMFSGCYSTLLDFWKEYAPDAAALLEGQDHTAVDLALPELNPFTMNMGFEQEEGLDGWEVVTTMHSPTAPHVDRKCDTSSCVIRKRCSAYEGNCYARLSAGDAQLGWTEPNSMKRYDFRVPEINQSCANQLLKGGDASDSSEYCFSFAMRFDAKDNFSDGKNDYFQVKVVLVDKGGEVVKDLFDRTIRISDVGDKGDSGWEVHQVQLPNAKIGKPMYFGMEAMVTNTGDFALDSMGMLDDLKIVPCS
jgi:hypothetical protein